MSDDPKKPEKPAPQAPDDESVPRQSGTDGNDPAVWDEATWNAAVWAGDSGTQPAHLPEGDPPPPRTLGAPHLASTSSLYSPTIRIETLSAETRFAQLQARVDALEKLIAAPPPIGPGHNNPPEAIDAEPLLPSRDEIAAVIVIIRMLDPASREVPAEAKAAQGTLERMIEKFRDGFADEAGKMTARVAVPVVAAAAVAILVVLMDVAHALAMWAEAVIRSAL